MRGVINLVAGSKFERMVSVEDSKSPRRRRVRYKSEREEREEDQISLRSAASTLSLNSEADASDMVRIVLAYVTQA